MIETSSKVFPVKAQCVYLAHCGVAPLYRAAAEAMQEFYETRSRLGAGAFAVYSNVLSELHAAAARLLETRPANISFVKNTAEGMSLIANGYPFREGDEIVSYVHEYPSNHYPWLLQSRRGAKLNLLPDRDSVGGLPADRPRGWSMDDLAEAVTERTRIVAISHVQFTSGYAADLPRLGRFCRDRGIDLVVDAAQSLGCLPLYPERCGISAVAASGWKWLLGPLGSGLLFTTPEFRAKIEPVVAGADVVVQGTDYLNHTWAPHADGRRFEYSTCQVSYALALTRCIDDLFAPDRIETVSARIRALRQCFLDPLDMGRFRPVLFGEANRSGILALSCEADPHRVASHVRTQGVEVTVRGGYLRIAPHFYNDEDEMIRAASAFNSFGG